MYVPDLGAAGGEVDLSASESHYVARVCRARVGDLLEGADGHGGVATLRVAAASQIVRVAVERIERRERTRRAWLVCGEPEGQRDDWMVEKLAELGIERWCPLDSERSRWEGFARRRERWERLAIAALKQSRSPHLMQIADPLPLDAVHELVPPGACRWLASPAGVSPPPPAGPGLLAAIVGPAGGFTGSEEKWLTGNGFLPVALGASRLRAETAAVVVGALWAAGR